LSLQEYQKGAIYRQMLEYKREKNNLEARLQELESKADDHDEHIRVIDAWWLQVRWVLLGIRTKLC
jgi:E3 ubiquitin-protein ligase BRE1